MSATKLITIFGCTGKLESSYNAGGTPSTSTDGILLEELPKLALSYANDGMRPPPPATSGAQRRVTPSARIASVPLTVAAKGGVSAYSGSVSPNISALLQMAGFAATLTVTGGSESVVYKPAAGATGFSSGVLNLYARQQLYRLTGVYADLEIDADGPVVPQWKFGLQGLAGAIDDNSVPSITYQNLGVDPPKATNIGFTLGNLTGAVVRKFGYKHNRQLGPRLNINAGGHAGFSPGSRSPTLVVTVETAAFATTPFTGVSTIDPWRLRDAGTELACSLQVGSVQYNRWKLATSKAQVVDVQENEDGPTSLTDLTLQFNPSDLTQSDDVQITFD
jgi:hypothetical protein